MTSKNCGGDGDGHCDADDDGVDAERMDGDDWTVVDNDGGNMDPKLMLDSWT